MAGARPSGLRYRLCESSRRASSLCRCAGHAAPAAPEVRWADTTRGVSCAARDARRRRRAGLVHGRPWRRVGSGRASRRRADHASRVSRAGRAAPWRWRRRRRQSTAGPCPPRARRRDGPEHAPRKETATARAGPCCATVGDRGRGVVTGGRARGEADGLGPLQPDRIAGRRCAVVVVDGAGLGGRRRHGPGDGRGVR
jgi:hypothetical protein